MPRSTAQKAKDATASASQSNQPSPDQTLNAETAEHAELICTAGSASSTFDVVPYRGEYEPPRVLGLGDRVRRVGHDVPGHPYFARNDSTVSDGGDPLAHRGLDSGARAEAARR